MVDKIRAAKPETIDIDRNLEADKFGRLLAKIAHAYACAELGSDAFDHSLPNIILNGSDDIHDYVGGELDPPRSEDAAIAVSFYTLGLAPVIRPNGFWVAARIRLFGGVESNGIGSPIYWVVVGRANFSAFEQLTKQP